MRFVMSLLLLTLLSTRTHAQAPQIDRIDVVEYGIYTANKQGTLSAPDTATGDTNIMTDIHHALTTRNVPAQQGIRFGFRYNLIGEPEGAIVTLHRLLIYPPSGVYNPARQQIFSRAEHDIARRIGETSYAAYTFDYNWEVVPGIWTFQIWYQGRKLTDQQFTVVKQ